MRSIAARLTLALTTSVAIATLACREPGPAERAGRSLDEAAEELRKSGREAADDLRRGLDEAADSVEKAVEQARERAHERERE